MKKSNSLGYAIILLILAPFTALWSGYVLSVLWGWFIVTTFEARPLGVLPAIGVAMVVSYLTNHNDGSESKDEDQADRFIRAIAVAIFRPAIALFIGWILHSFM